MTRKIGVQVALFTFAVALLVGLFAGNQPTTILLRALTVMAFALIIAQVVAWTAKLVMRDHLQRTKLAIDQDHAARTELIRQRRGQTGVTEDVPEAAAHIDTGS